MLRSSLSRVALPALLALLFATACSSSGDSSTTNTDDTGTSDDGGGDETLDLDSSGSDGSPETSASDGSMGETSDAGLDADATDSAEASLTCTDAGAVESEACGKCGLRGRLCGDDGTWLPWGACAGEKGVCVPADTRMEACGRCGKRTDTCDATCGWVAGACTGEGACNPGDSETQYGACAVAKQVKIRTCDTTCTWSDWSACMAPKDWNDIALAPIAGRQYHTAIWTGSEMIVWGGQSSSLSYASDGAAYNLSTDSWRVLEAAPIVGRYGHTAVWTGSKMLVWGGYYGSLSPYYRNDGAAYDPSAKTWATLPAPTVTSPTAYSLLGRQYHSAVWTGTEMIVWGGLSSSGTGCTSGYCNDGAAYNPTTGAWRILKASPLVGRYYHRAVWTGSKMIVFGGYGACSGSYCGDAAAYDPVADSWTTLTPPLPDLDARYEHMSVATGSTGSLATFWGGYGSYSSPGYGRNTGATYDDSKGTWTKITPPSDTLLPNSRRYQSFLWWGANKLWMWGGYDYSYGPTGTGASYDPTTDSWTVMPTTNAPAARYNGTVVWTGAEAILWGGYSYKNDGKIYRP